MTYYRLYDPVRTRYYDNKIHKTREIALSNLKLLQNPTIYPPTASIKRLKVVPVKLERV